MDISAFLEEFRLESLEHLELLSRGLLRLEGGDADPQILRGMFLSAHTIKGGASMLSLGAIKALVHALEDVLGGLRDGQHAADAPTLSLLFSALDALRDLVEAPAQNQDLSAPFEALLERLRGWPASLEPSATASSPLPSPRRVLLLEPSATARLALSEQLKHLGYAVEACDTLEKALEVLGRSRFELTVCALEPGGLSPALLLARLPPETRVLGTALEEPSEALGYPVVIKRAWPERGWLEAALEVL